jgi:hypothetical protein
MGELSFIDQLTQGLTINEFGGDEMDGLGLTDLVDGYDVGMIQARGGVCLALEASQAFFILSEVCG